MIDNIDLSLFDDPDMTCPDVPFLDPSILIPSFTDVNTISNQLNQLNVDLNTQDLRGR